MSDFVHLHRHSEYSRLDGTGTARQYAMRAADLGQFALAQTDHGTLSGALHHIRACQEAGILPVSGVEAYFRPDRALAKKFGQRESYHLCLFAKNLRGWHNLLRLVTISNAEVEDGGGFYQKPCIDFALLKANSEGLICSSACISSWLSKLIQKGDSVAVADYLNQMVNIFGDDFYLEIMPHDFQEQIDLNIELVRLAQERGIKLIATNDAHFPFPEWAETQRIAKMMGSNKSFKKLAEKGEGEREQDYLTHASPTLYLSSEDEMRAWFRKAHPTIPHNLVDESLSNTGLLVQSLQPFMLGKAFKLPKVVDSPEEAERILREWIAEGLEKAGKTDDPIYLERIKTEFTVLKSKGVLDYFVMVGDVVRWCKENGIRVGLGRGSAAGCLISYLVGIVGIDPIPYGLLFERFLNPQRKGLPDIDLDFQSNRRGEVKEYIAERYGRDHVADIITHTTFQPKKVIQDLCRVYDDRVSYAEAMAVTGTIEIRADDEETTLEELLPINEKLREFKKKFPEIWVHAIRLEGSVANAGKHAAGVIITPKPVAEYMALERGKKGDLVTSWSDGADFPVVSDYGFVKLDALGIAGLQKHDYACKLIAKRTGEIVKLDELPALTDPYDVDEDVMQGFRDGYTIGVFQFGSRGITNLLKDISPDHILDIAAANALYRPGPMKGGVHRDYAKGKHSLDGVEYWHDLVEPILSETYGVVAYQEQVMRISQMLGKFTAAQADDLRKAMGKLYRIKGGTAAKDFMGKFEKQWFKGCEENGISADVADEIWHKILEFGHYGFNKSHSASYALQAYQDMWLKIKYPAEFYAAFLTHEEDEDKAKAAMREAKARGIEIVMPDVNLSQAGYNVDDEGRLILGLTAIKGIGHRAAELVIEEREVNSFTSIEDFLFRAGKHANTKSLVESGALDSLRPEGMEDLEFRIYLLSIVEKRGTKITSEWAVWEHLKHNTKLKKPREVPTGRVEPALSEVQKAQAVCLGLPISSMNLPAAQKEFLDLNIWTPDEMSEAPNKTYVIIGGEVSKIEYKQTQKKKPYANVTLTYEGFEWIVKLWQEKLMQYEHLLTEGRVLVAAGAKDEWNGFLSVVASELDLLEDVVARGE